MASDPLSQFLPPVGTWFRRALGEPTPVQRAGWPVIASGQHALLLAPTGSGKTLAAFLACLDGLWRQEALTPGVRVLYISPLKALNYDIYRNLQLPLEGVQAEAAATGLTLPVIEIAVRTGDTPAAERQRLLRRPPHVLITTPESLHLLLTSRARGALGGVTHCIVDEIHALCPNKRGVFLALLLERLAALCPRPFSRIGLSATQRPLEEVARYLGGLEADGRERPVTIVDAGLRKNLDLRVVSPVEQFGPLPEQSIWPSIYRLLAHEICSHRSTLIFANNRRSVERITAQLNELLQTCEGKSEIRSPKSETNSNDQTPNAERAQRPVSDLQNSDFGFVSDFDIRASDFVRAHHGSVSLEVRRATEEALKEGRLRAVVATASLELGIDMGAIDLVCQVESPGNIARGLQRVGRAGHLVGQQSQGRLIPKTLPDLLNQAVLAAEMAAGRVEELRVPANCLDVLAQQVVAMVAMEDWPVETLYRRVRQAYPFRDLTAAAFDAVLEMVSGRFRLDAAEAGADARAEGQSPAPRLSPSQRLSALQPRVSWDRVHNRLQALPGSQRLALTGGGTIPDTGQYGVYAPGGLRVGEVDEEFVYERRIGDSFLLGTSAWRITKLETDRVLVEPTVGGAAIVPFWRGENVGRTADLGLAQARFLGELSGRIEDADCLAWLRQEHFLDEASAQNLRDFARRQIARAGCLPSDRTITVEASRDTLGDWQVVVLTPFGSRFHLAMRLALENALGRRLGYRPQCIHADDGLLIRLTESDEPVLDVFAGVTGDNVRSLVLDELAHSALFALRFRQNAARALMMPRGRMNRRAPLWLQRLRGRDLLQVARRYPDFPIVAETFRECLHDHLDVPRLEHWLADLHAGRIEVRTLRLESPTPFAASLLFSFTMAYMYQYDDVEPGSRDAAPLNHDLLDHLVAGSGDRLALDDRAVRQVDRRLRGTGRPPRTAAEMAEWLRRVGDVSVGEFEGPMAAQLAELEGEGRVQRVALSGVVEPERWVLTEEADRYRLVFGDGYAGADEQQEAAAAILLRYLDTHALVGLDDILKRYPFERTWAQHMLEEWAQTGRLVRVPPADAPEPLQWSVPENLDQVRRGTLAIHRREVIACPPAQFADFSTHWQFAHPATQRAGAEGLVEAVTRLQAVLLPTSLWEEALLPARMKTYEPRWLDELIGTGGWTWMTHADDLTLLPRDLVAQLPPPDADSPLDPTAASVLSLLEQRGAQYAAELAGHLRLPEGPARTALWELMRHGLVTNDRFEVARRGEPPVEAEPRFRTHRELTSFLRRSTHRPVRSVPEGRWSQLAWGQPDAETRAIVFANVLLERHGIVSREMAGLDPAAPAWRILYEVFSRMELAGELRRGYFVEGLSGAQFALPEAARVLQDLAVPAQPQPPLILLHSLDPANLYGSGAPFDLPLIAGGTRPYLRRAGNWLVVAAGKPVLLIEHQGKRLTALPSAADDVARAVAMLPRIMGTAASRDLRHKLMVETWNEQPVTATEGKDLLERAGFVRDYQAMTLYAVWQ
jgi:ATP-dependent Lhr-like helicase